MRPTVRTQLVPQIIIHDQNEVGLLKALFSDDISPHECSNCCQNDANASYHRSKQQSQPLRQVEGRRSSSSAMYHAIEATYSEYRKHAHDYYEWHEWYS